MNPLHGLWLQQMSASSQLTLPPLPDPICFLFSGLRLVPVVMPHVSVQGSRLVQRYIEDRKLERLVREIGAAGAASGGDAPSGHAPVDPKQVRACAC